MPQRTYKRIDSRDVPDILQQGAALVDVRRPEEWQLTGIVAGSHMLTFFDEYGSCHPEEWVRQLNELVPVEQPILLI